MGLFGQKKEAAMEKETTKEIPVVLGRKYRDKLHGFEGIAISYTQYRTGCDRVLLEYMKDGELKHAAFDIIDIEEVELTEKQKSPGGPGDAVAKPSCPQRA